MTKKIYLLYCDVDNGKDEDWSIFYTPVEAFATSEDREERISYILSQNPTLDREENFLKEAVEIFRTPGQIQDPLPHTLKPDLRRRLLC